MAHWAKRAEKRTEGSFHSSSGQVVACTRVRGRCRRLNNALCIKREIREHSWLATRVTGLPLLVLYSHPLRIYKISNQTGLREFQSMMPIFIYIHIYLFCHKVRLVIIIWVWQQSHYSEQKGHVSHPESVPA